MQWLKSVPFEWGHYLAGFVDGEGSFNISLRRRDDHQIGWQVVLTFNVSQKESYILSQLKKFLGCGRLQTRKDGLYYYTVSNPLAIKEKILPFFERFPFRSQRKKTNFALFKKAALLVFQKRHLTPGGLKEIVSIRERLNEGRGRTRKYEMRHVQSSWQENPQRLHAKPRAFRKEALG